MQAESKKINIRGIEHYYQWVRRESANSSKLVLVFMHGWGGSSRYWEDVARILSEFFDCLLYDFRGFGRSGLSDARVPSLSYELEEYAEDLVILLTELGIEKIILSAHSFGASIATLFAHRYPEKIDKLILTCSGIFVYNKLTFSAFHAAGTLVVKLRYRWFLQVPFAGRLFMVRFVHRGLSDRWNKMFLEDYLLADREAATETIKTAVSKQAAEEMPKAFAGLQMPTLLIMGEKDQIIPPRLGKSAAVLNSQIKYVEIPQTGHFPMLEDPETYMQQVSQFLEIN
ncbi:MAG: alpha/beta hydrolase [Cyanobacteria bacterium SBLK]|nr:alpha/beta hydrolase [Cyanobacteria bacterium SBLK]